MIKKFTLFPPAGLFLFLVFLFVLTQRINGQNSFYWEEAEVFSRGQGNFPVTAYNGNIGIVVWQEPIRRSVSGPAGTGDGSINIAAAATATQTEILIFDDEGRTFKPPYPVPSNTDSSLAPRIAECSDGTYLLFVTRGLKNSLSIYYARSVDGQYWSDFEPFVADPEMRLNFLPSHASLGGREYVVFQSVTVSAETVPAFQLFIKISDDGGRRWSPSRRFTQFRDAHISTTAPPDVFDNQRRHLSVQGNTLFLAWERRYRTNSPQIYALRVGADGTPIGAADMVSSGDAYCNNPVAFSVSGEMKLLWFDNRRGINRVYLAQQIGTRWEEKVLPFTFPGEASFARSIVDNDGLFVFRQNSSGGTTRIISLIPDTTVDAPRITAGTLGTWNPSWTTRPGRRFSFDTGYLVLVSIFVLCMLGLAVSIRGIGETIAEGAAIRLDAAALLTGDIMPSEKKMRFSRIRKRGLGLRLKLTLFTTALVIVVVVMVSVPLSLIMTQTRRDSLLKGLWDRSTVLLEGIATNARTYIPLKSVLELGLLPSQMNSVPEARYITITGYDPGTPVFDDQVWASNDPDILEKIDTVDFHPGISRITDILSPRLQGIAGELNERARLDVGSISESIVSLTREGQSLALRTDDASIRRLDDIHVQIPTLQTRESEGLSKISETIRAEPEFSLNNFVISPDHRYIFLKPVMYRQGSEDAYFRGLVRMEVSIDSILEEIAAERRNIIRVILLVALAAQAIGVLGALVVSTLIIHPIRQLVRHVEIIRDTEDKARLEGLDIKVKSQDELAVLGNTINDMTHDLVKAAAAASDLSIGKEIQKKFIPLELDRDGNKLSYGSKGTKFLDFFCYYEGAKGISGDYFDFQDLDGRYYAIIKCDVAGKGVPAALIMIQVATMFLNYFKQWKPTEKGMRIEDVVYQINDFIETLGFKGRFAAFTLCLYDSQTGIVRFCNAGDNIIHLFDASEGKMKTLTLPETPAAGVLPNSLVESKSGYKVQTVAIDHGDILLLYTDGIEEAKRKFRNKAYQEIICEEGEKDTAHATHTVGQGDEEMGPDRVQDIINAVMNREMYTLYKWHNPEGDMKLQFDFSNSKGSVEEVIKAMVSVEKMFRCYRDPRSADDSRVLVDKTVDSFLKEHFLQYRDYCSFVREIPGNTAYMYYTHVKEDEQYDDLTILGIKRK